MTFQASRPLLRPICLEKLIDVHIADLFPLVEHAGHFLNALAIVMNVCNVENCNDCVP